MSKHAPIIAIVFLVFILLWVCSSCEKPKEFRITPHWTLSSTDTIHKPVVWINGQDTTIGEWINPYAEDKNSLNNTPLPK